MDSNDIRSRLIEEELRSVWPGWHVVRRLGGGSFGDVFQIYRDNYGIRVDSALKVIQMDDWMATVALPSNSRDESSPDIPEALRSEIQIMEALRGAPNIVSIEDFAYKRVGQTSTLLVRMELLKSLQEVLPGRNGQGTLSSIREITKLGKDVCRALMYCEKRGIIHRDIKPANLFVDRFGDYKVGDFGASKRMETVHVAQTMTGIGTISYMAPEIFRGQSYNNTVDIYALGLVLYQLLNNGRMAFLPDSGAYSTQDIDSANYQRLHGTPVPSLAGKYVGGERIDNRLDAVVRKACAMNPADRYRTAKEFFDALALTEMPERKAEPEYGRSVQSTPRQAVPVQERQEYRQAGPGQKSAGGTATASPVQGRQEYRKPEPEIKSPRGAAADSPVQWRQQESERARAKSGPSAAPRQAASPPPVRSYQSRHQKKGLPGGVIPMVAIVLVCIIVSVALTSLGSRRGGSTGTSSSAPADSASTEGDIRLVNGKIEVDAALKAAAAAYKEETGISVAIESIESMGSGVNIQDTLKGYYQADNMPDIFVCGSDADFGIWTAGGLLADLSNEAWVADTDTSYVDADGRVIGFPYTTEAIGLAYNADILEKAGIDPASITGPESMRAAFETLDAKKDELGLTAVIGWCCEAKDLYWSTGSHSFANYIDAGLDRDDTTYSDMLADGGKIDAERFQHYAEMVALFNQYSDPALLTSGTYDQQILGFASGKYAFVTQGSWIGATMTSYYAAEYEAAGNFKVGMIPYAFEEGIDTILTNSPSWWAVFENDNTQKAKDFLTWLAGDAGQKFLVEDAGFISPFKSCKYVANDPFAQTITDYTAAGKTSSWHWLKNKASLDQNVLGQLYLDFALGYIPDPETFTTVVSQQVAQYYSN